MGVNQIRHYAFGLEADGRVERREGSLPASIKRAPVQAVILADTDPRLAARLLRQLADEIEEQGEVQ